jgi:hypothetical protein
MAGATGKKCFVIGPIGDPDSPARINADWVLHLVIKPVLEKEPFSYTVTRADEMTVPGNISSQVIQAVLDADLIVADLTGHNPNAFYELALAHMAAKKVIPLITAGEKIPFDVAQDRIIAYSRVRVEDIEEARAQLRKHAESIEADGYTISNPVTLAKGVQKLTGTADPEKEIIAELLSSNQALKAQLQALQDMVYQLAANQQSPRIVFEGEGTQTTYPKEYTLRKLSPVDKKFQADVDKRILAMIKTIQEEMNKLKPDEEVKKTASKNESDENDT